ncbi:MAG: hypothetical protein PF517_04695 [Salinivirgaceae bacterium]|jgi:hypothetical protein|nr:hypothetical protein [Salinivirgaceae bacterium]
MIYESKSEILGIIPSKRNNNVDLIIKPNGQLEKIKCTVFDERLKRRLHLYNVGDIPKIRFKIEAKQFGGGYTNYITLMEIM